ncbi:MAG: carbohydrate ABC transporter permease [Chloroflexi bacterium]|nr:carbohydrate ABC transporter permease [Chloroflexota bacterium]
MLGSYPFPSWFANTVIYAVFVTILRLAFDLLAGYALARMTFPGRRLMFFVVLGTLMIPAVVLIIPRFIILREIGILNTYQGLIFALAADAFGVFLMKQFFESIPTEIEEAAQVDGANRFTMFFRIVLPMATPAPHRADDLQLSGDVEQLHGRADHRRRQGGLMESAAGHGAAQGAVRRDAGVEHVPRRRGVHHHSNGDPVLRLPALLRGRRELFGPQGMTAARLRDGGVG